MEATVLEQSPVNTRRLSPAETVIAVFGGVRVLARLLECNPSTVSVWQKRTGGRVPDRHHTALLALATKHGKRLSTNDLILGRVMPRRGARR